MGKGIDLILHASMGEADDVLVRCHSISMNPAAARTTSDKKASRNSTKFGDWLLDLSYDNSIRVIEAVTEMTYFQSRVWKIRTHAEFGRLRPKRGDAGSTTMICFGILLKWKRLRRIHHDGLWWKRRETRRISVKVPRTTYLTHVAGQIHGTVSMTGFTGGR